MREDPGMGRQGVKVGGGGGGVVWCGGGVGVGVGVGRSHFSSRWLPDSFEESQLSGGLTTPAHEHHARQLL